MGILLSHENPERVTLRAGVAAPETGGGESNTPSQGILYGFRREGWWRATYPALNENNAFGDRNLSYVSRDVIDAFTGPSETRDRIWIATGQVLRRHPLKTNGDLLDADFFIARSKIAAGGGTRFQADRVGARSVIYAQVGQELQAYLLPSGDAFSTLNTRLMSDVVRWDIKTAGDTRHIAQVKYAGNGASTAEIFYQGEKIGEVMGVTAVYQLALNVRATNKPFFILVGSDGTRRAWTLDAEGTVLSKPDISDALQFAASADGIALPFAQFDRETLARGRVLPSMKALAKLEGQSVARLTEAQEGGFREVREVYAEVSIEPLNPDFLANQDWYFVHKELVYSMVEMSADAEGVVATMKVE